MRTLLILCLLACAFGCVACSCPCSQKDPEIKNEVQPQPLEKQPQKTDTKTQEALHREQNDCGCDKKLG